MKQETYELQHVNLLEQKQEFKEIIIKSRSEYLKKKNEIAFKNVKER